MTLSEWFTVTTVAGLAIMSPGPGFAIVVRNSLVYGRQAGLATAIGNACGDMAYIALNLLGIGYLVTNSPGTFEIIKLAGALYLFWLGLKNLLRKPQSDTEILEFPHENSSRAFWDGLLTTLLNPKSFIFVFALFSMIVSKNTPLHYKAFYGGWVGFLSVSWFAIVAIFFTKTRLRQKLQSYRHWLDRITGAVLIGFSLTLLMP